MRRSARQAGSPRAVLGFWALTLTVALVLGAGAFAVGKYLVGGMLKHSEVDQGAPRIVVQNPDDSQTESTPNAGPPPREAVVKMAQREPTEAEKQEVELAHPQDGAQLNQQEHSADSPDASTGSDSKPLGDHPATAAGTDQGDGASPKQAKPAAGARPGAYSVVTGSFADPANADKEVSRLVAQGYKPYVTKVKREGKTFHRVCVGAFGDQDKAVRLRDRLVGDGTQAAVTRD